MMAKLQTKKVSELPLIIKADVQGSAEAIVGSLDKIATDEVRARIIQSAPARSARATCCWPRARLADPRLQRPRLEPGPRPGRA